MGKGEAASRAQTCQDDKLASPAEIFATSRCIVLKIGSSLIVDPRTGGAAVEWLAALAEDIACLVAEGRRVIVVSSGAVALGRGSLGLAHSARLEEKQAAAAVGQSRLMHAWAAALAPHRLIPAQLLLTRDDTERRRRWLNARATLQALLDLRAVPIVNENDTVATEELRYGDNDRLAARTAQLAGAELLVLLSDIDGLYTADPQRDPMARHVPWIEALTPEILAMAGGANAGVGTGGMRTKLEAARIARSAGCTTIILSGAVHRPLSALQSGARASLITAASTPLAAYKQWIAGSVAPAGVLRIDLGAVTALAVGRSLLPSGICGVDGRFDRGDSVRITGLDGGAVGVGLTAYAADEVLRILGRRSSEIEGLLGYKGPDVVVHRDDMVLMTP